MAKKYTHITQRQRCQIEALKKAGHKPGDIAKQLSVNNSSIYCELQRNKSNKGGYNASFAQQVSNEKKERFAKNRKFSYSMQNMIKQKISQEQWSPEQICGYCKKNKISMVSHERIYQYIYQDKKDGGDLYKHLRTASKKYRKRYGSGKNKRVIIKDKVSIDKRPDLINNKERYGDWEIDTIIGKNQKGAMVTVAERKSGFILIKKLNGKNAKQLAKAVVKLLAPYKENVLSITADNGSEFANHKYISQNLGTEFYFAHPYSSWERGLNEYSNKLIRQYIPKKSNFDDFYVNDINLINMKLNKRPRKLLNFYSPLFIFLSNFKNIVALAS